MTNSQRFPLTEVVIAAIAIALISAVAYVSGRNREAAALHFDTYSTYDTASGGYRAWYELLNREGVRVERFERRPAFLDQSVDVYVMASNAYGAVARAIARGETTQLVAGDWDAIAKWVRAGGHFVFIADGQTFPEYMNAPHLRLVGPLADAAVTVAPSTLTDGVASVSGNAKLRTPFEDSAGAAPMIADDTGGVVVSYALGKGTVTIDADESLFDNARLTKADNARLAYDLATVGLGARGFVAFDEWSHGYDAGDTWWQVLPRSFQIALVIIAAALCSIIVATGLRFGPTARLPDESERTSAEYLSSMALLYERGRAARTAIGELADSCMRQVAASLGLSESASARTIAARLGGTGHAIDLGEAIMELDRLRSYEYPHAADLLRAARYCAALRKEHTGHGRIGIGRRASAARRPA